MLDRRTALAALSAAAVSSSTGIPAAAPAPLTRKPPRLRPGDTVGLIEPAGFTVDRFDLEAILDTVRAMGLVPKPAPHVMKRYGYLAGTDQERADDVDAMFADRDVRAIFAVRGGWGSARTLPYLDFDTIRANPKLLVGFSDVTALHLALAAKTGCPSIHGPTLSSSWGALSWDSFKRLAFDAETPTWRMPGGGEDRLVPRRGRVRTFGSGKASGRLLGGNLAVLAAMVGTPYMPDMTGAILFLEEVDEAEYRIDRMMTQLALSGLLGKVAGVVFGQCTNCGTDDSPGIGFSLSEILDNHLKPLGVPAFQGAPFGHVANQVSLPVGIRAEIDADAGTIRILEAVVT
ncbi:LD-carboxypeptidase [Novosphingobium sp. PS1R-30]|uniref:LD-carboxypeptidase n=1 Tax=Novosphingobium anseongense TaxID=3133436 RepID=A0ABU8RPV2_9SPHN